MNVIGDAGRALLADLLRDPHLEFLANLNEESGEAVRDWVTANRLTGTVDGSPTFNVDLGGGLRGMTLASASTQTINFGSSRLNKARTDAWSILATIKPTVGAIIAPISRFTLGGAIYGWIVYVDATGYLTMWVEDDAGGTLTVRTSAALTTATVYQVGITLSGSGTAAGVVMYVNGAAVAMTTVTDTLAGNTGVTADLHVGSVADGLYHWNGGLGPIAVFNAVKPAQDFRRWAFRAGLI